MKPCETKGDEMKTHNQSKKDGANLSVILCLHEEGLIAIPTLKSLYQAKKFAESHSLSVEIITVLDNPSMKTQLLVEEQKAQIDQIVRVNFNDPGLSRNKGIELAVGECIALADGDDLMSENWLYEAYKLAKDRDVVVHPEANLIFGKEKKIIFRHIPQHEFATLLSLFDENPWTMLSCAKKSIFLKNPLEKSSLAEGYGYEDWHWNCEVAAQQIEHIIAPGTVHFIRQKRKNSQLALSQILSCVIKPTQLAFTSPLFLKQGGTQLSRRKNKLIKKRLIELVLKKTEDVAQFELQLKQPKLLKKSIMMGPGSFGLGKIFAMLLLCGQAPKKLIVCSKASKEVMEYAHGIGESTLVVSEKRSRIEKLKKNGLVTVLNFSGKKPNVAIKRFLIDYIIQYQPTVVTNMGSTLCDQLFEEHGEKIAQYSKLEMIVNRKNISSADCCFVGYPNYCELLDHFLFEDDKTKLDFMRYYNF